MPVRAGTIISDQGEVYGKELKKTTKYYKEIIVILYTPYGKLHFTAV